MISKSKNDFENKIANQIDLFEENEDEESNIIEKIDDWNFEERLSKEFEAVGFFISNHPLNQFKEIFDDYKIIDYIDFNHNDESKEANVAATLLKVQERKTAKGNSYAVLKLTDLNSVFELFIFSDMLELNREILKEGNSLIITLNKSFSNDENQTKRINARKIASLKDLFNSPIKEVTLNIKSENQLEEISTFLNKKGDTIVNINFCPEEDSYKFKLKNNRNIDRKSINLIRSKEINAIIS